MDEKLWSEAEKLASRQYTIEVGIDTLSDGNRVHFARVLELPGCMAQGETSEQLYKELNAARHEYIYNLLVDRIDVPNPIVATVTTGVMMPKGDEVVPVFFAGKSLEEQIDTVIEPEAREMRVRLVPLKGQTG